MITDNEIREKLKTAIRTSGKTQKDIAKNIGITQQSLNQYLKDRALPTLATLANICRYLDLDANEILCINDNKTENKYVNSFNNAKISADHNSNIKF